MGVSLRPSDAISGGLLDDVDVHIDKARYEIFDYQGKSDPAPALVLHCTLEDGEKHDEALSIGRASDWQPSDDGTELIPVGGATALRDKCKAILFLQSLVNAGFDEDLLADGNPSVMDGLGVHLSRVTVDYKGLEKRRDAEGREQEFTVLNVSKINYLPGEGGKKAAGGGKGKAAAGGGKKAAASGGKKAAGGGGGKGKAASKSDAEPDADLDQAAETALMTALVESGGSMEARSIPTKVYRYLDGVANRNQVLQRAYAEDFLAREDAPWEYEDGTVSLPE